jgi:restriction system protein
MLPMLELMKDGKEHLTSDLILNLADFYKLTDEERSKMLPSKRARQFDNRSHWARKYLKESGLVNATRRGYIQITDRGQDVLKSKPEFINIKYLKQFEELREFLNISNASSETQNGEEDTSLEHLSPEDAMENSYQTMNNLLAKELLSQIESKPPSFFEKLVIRLLLQMGYGTGDEDSGIVTKTSGDEGIDGIISEDKLGLDKIYVQAKKWKDGSSIGRPEIQKFVGALHGQRANKGIFITTSKFSSDAYEYINRIEPKVILIDGIRLTKFMIEYNVGVQVEKEFYIKRIDTDYFDEI